VLIFHACVAGSQNNWRPLVKFRGFELSGLWGRTAEGPMDSNQGNQSSEERRTAEFLALLGQHELKLASCIHLLVPSWQDAEDILQETKLRLWRDFSTYRPGSDFLAWARTVARFVVRARAKQNQRRPLYFSSEVQDLILNRLAAMPERSDWRLELLADCVKRLKRDMLVLLRRYYVDGRKIKDIAAEHGRSLAGTYMALSRVRRELFDCVQDHLHEENSP
jgi:RNA polymerase sigma-70 factor, ECF subfamily